MGQDKYTEKTILASLEVFAIKIKRKIIELLYPRRCPICDKIVPYNEGLACRKCYKELVFIENPTCKKCGKQISVEESEYCYDCCRYNYSYNSGKALLQYNEIMKKSLSRYKYGGRQEYSIWYTDELLKRYQNYINMIKPDVLIPVPIYKGRYKKRGFNQAELISRGISKATGIKTYVKILERIHNTVPQSSLASKERKRNLEQVFMVKKSIKGIKSVLLIDDIYTTGSTIEACSRVLKNAGVLNVYYMSVCIGVGE